MRIAAALCFLVALVASTSASAVTISQGFDGGSVKCVANGIQSLTPGKVDTTKITRGERVKGSARVVDGVGRQHDYTFVVTTRTTALQKIGAARRNFSEKIYDFQCAVHTNEGVAHTCHASINRTAGSCFVCSGNGCKNVTFSVSRR